MKSTFDPSASQSRFRRSRAAGSVVYLAGAAPPVFEELREPRARTGMLRSRKGMARDEGDTLRDMGGPHIGDDARLTEPTSVTVAPCARCGAISSCRWHPWYPDRRRREPPDRPPHRTRGGLRHSRSTRPSPAAMAAGFRRPRIKGVPTYLSGEAVASDAVGPSTRR